MSDLRTRIAKASASRNAKNAGMDPEDFWDSLHSSLQEAYLLDADAVIRELVSDCIYRYACANCGDFWFDQSERMQRFALLHSRSHLAVIQETQQCEKAGGGFSQWHRYVTDWKATDE